MEVYYIILSTLCMFKILHNKLLKIIIKGRWRYDRSWGEDRIWRRPRGHSRLSVSVGTKHTLTSLFTESKCIVSALATLGSQCFCPGAVSWIFLPPTKHQAEVEEPLQHSSHLVYTEAGTSTQVAHLVPALTPPPNSLGNSRKLHGASRCLPFSGPQFSHG